MMNAESAGFGGMAPGHANAVTRSSRLALVAMLFAVAMTFIDQTIVAIASPTIQAELSLTNTGTQWVVNSYLLALAATFALGGRLADVLGSRRMVVIGILGFAVTSALCGATPKGSAAQTWIVVFRALQGVFGALMIPAAVAVVVAAFPVRERGRALALFFGVSGALTAIGPIAGGFLTQWTWRAIFWINIPVALLALVLTARAGIAPSQRGGRIDFRGAVLAAVGMGLSVLGFQQAQTWGWHSVATWACLVAGAAVLVVFAVLQLRTREPLLQLRIFDHRAVVIDCIVLFLSAIAFIPSFFFASVYAQVSLGYDANKAGLYLLMIFAGFGPASQLGGRMLDRGRGRRSLVLGSALSCVGFALWASHIDHFSLSAQWPYIVMAGAGLGLVVGPASTDTVNHAIGASYGEVTGITQTVRNYASSLGLAVLGTLLTTTFTHRFTDTLTGIGVPHTAAVQAAKRAASGRSSAAAAHLPAAAAEHLRQAVALDFAHATRVVFIGMAVALGASCVAAWFCPRDAPVTDRTDSLESSPA
jgi:EmrB/QacA subfamily drug resistance transporter